MNAEAVALALAASFFTASASVCQRLGTRVTEDVKGIDFMILFRLAREPIWLLGLLSMIVGFVLQFAALRISGLALVQPILATELLIVFAYMTLIGRRRATARDWLAVTAMVLGLAMFLFTASPSGGRLHAARAAWIWAAVGCWGAVILMIALAFGLGHHGKASRTRRGALLGVATGTAWGFVAADIKELSSHLQSGFGSVFSAWSLYVLLIAGAIAMLLGSHALSAGSLAAAQPGFTIVDPMVASVLGVVIFHEHLSTQPVNLLGEALSILVIIVGVAVLSHSHIVAPYSLKDRYATKRESENSRA